MIKKLLGLIMVLGFSCSDTNKEDNLFLNSDLKNIIDKIIYENKAHKTLVVELFDEENNTLVAIFLYDYLENCNEVKGIYQYRNVNLIFIDSSKVKDFDSLIDFKKSIDLDQCVNYINLPNPEDRIDYSAYPYLLEKDGIKYTNKKDLIYKNGSVVLRTVF